MSRASNSVPCPWIEPVTGSSNGQEQEPTKTTRQKVEKKSPRYERQQRYREKQRLYADHLESIVKRLRLDVDLQLIARHNAQAARLHLQLFGATSQLSTMKAADVIAIMRECMQSFESGVQPQQERFLEAAMRSDVHYGEFVGRGCVVQQWMRLTTYFNCVAPVLEQCAFSVGFLGQDTAMGHVSAMLVVHLTHFNLDTIFPHVLARVREKLVQSSILRLPMAVFFQFDEQGKVCCCEHTINFVAGLYTVLGDYSDVSNTLQSANINAYGQICEELPPAAISSPRASCPCDHRDAESDCTYRSTDRLKKFSVAFLLSSGEGVRCTDRQATS